MTKYKLTVCFEIEAESHEEVENCYHVIYGTISEYPVILEINKVSVEKAIINESI